MRPVRTGHPVHRAQPELLSLDGQNPATVSESCPHPLAPDARRWLQSMCFRARSRVSLQPGVGELWFLGGAHGPGEDVKVDVIHFDNVKCHGRVRASQREWGAPGKGITHAQGCWNVFYSK